ncbi:MAG: hypothetical protein LBP22_16770 [Deltaproteobacteria bacterium]|jgi:hypothetical protein|nr:hypothetical protein [Deltaproteobacteria bacterium]
MSQNLISFKIGCLAKPFIILFLSLFLFPGLGLLRGADPASAADIRDYFLKVPDGRAHGLSSAARQELLNRAAQKTGYTIPSEDGFWVVIHGGTSLTLFGNHRAPIVYKTFSSKLRWQLLAICQSRQTSGPTEKDPASPERLYDLFLMQIDQNDDLNTASIDNFLPPISVLDFVTADTTRDRRAVRDLAVINEYFSQCLTCHASVLDPQTLDILTVTSISGHSCSGFLAQFKLLPLYWNGEYFIKPHDRAAPPEDRRAVDPQKPHGPYYRPPNE